MQNIIIRTRARAFVSLAVVAFMLTILFTWLYVDRIKHQKESVDIIRSVYFGLAIAMGALLVRAIMNMFNKKPALAIVEQGIIDYMNLDGAQIPWENIEQAELIKIGVQEAMAVYVNNSDELVGKLKKIKQRMALAKISKTGTPILLSTKLYDYNVQEVIDLINSKARAIAG